MLNPTNMNVLKNPIIYSVFLEYFGGWKDGGVGERVNHSPHAPKTFPKYIST